MTDAVIAGGGHLAGVLARAAPEPPLIVALEGFAPADLAPDITFRLEGLGGLFDDLHRRGVTRVCFAGAVQRPRIDPARIDAATAALLPRMQRAMMQGDDATLREVIALFEEARFAVVGADAVAPDLVRATGVLAGEPGAQDRRDAARAAEITHALGAVDVGQGCVVQQGLCLAVEALPGTDAMLMGVAMLPTHLRPDAGAAGDGRGLLYKAPKPGQARRIDLPALGPRTIRHVIDAGLGGIAWEAGGVLVLDLSRMQEMARDAGIFLWARRQ